MRGDLRWVGPMELGVEMSSTFDVKEKAGLAPGGLVSATVSKNYIAGDDSA